MNRLFVVIAIFPHGDADCVAVCPSAAEAVKSWRRYMTEYCGDTEKLWLETAAHDLENYGRTDRHYSGVFYRLNLMRAIAE